MKLLFLDVETTPAVVYTWALRKQDISVDQIITPTSLLCFSATWLDDKDGETVFYRSVKQSGKDFDAMVRAAHKMLSEADAVCHFNGMSFDIPRLNQEFLRLGMAPPPAIPQIDLKKVVMSKFSMVSSRLMFVGPYLKIGEKVKHEGWKLWIDCLAGDQEAWESMEKYNKQDVVLLKKLYRKLLPWIDNHPNMNLYKNGEKPVCPNCGGLKLVSNGLRRALTYTYRRLQCLGCGHWSRERTSTKSIPVAPVRD